MEHAELKQKLTELPSKISYQSMQAERARLDWQVAQARLEYSKAKESIEIKILHPTKSQTEIRTEITALMLDPQLETIRKESDYRVALIMAKELDDDLKSCKVSARLLIAEMTTGITLPPTKGEE